MNVKDLKNYPAVKAEVKRVLDSYHELYGFPNDDKAIMTLSHQLCEIYDVTLRFQETFLMFQLYLTPWRGLGALAIVVAEETVEKAALVSYCPDMFEVLQRSKEEQLVLLENHWLLTTTREMVRKVIEAIIEKAEPSHDMETLEILLENIEILPEESQYFAQPFGAVKIPKQTVICWFIQYPELYDTSKMVNSEIIPVKRLPEFSKERYDKISRTCSAITLMVSNVNNAMRD